MSQRFLLNLVLVITILALSGCSDTGKTMKLTADDNGTEISVQTGEMIQITLDANPTTGYQWEWVKDEFSVVELSQDPDYKSSALPGLVGAGGQTTFTFKAVKSGTAAIHLVYYRSFEPDVPPIEEFQVKVTVK